MISRLAWWEYLPVEFCVEELNAYYLVCSLYKVSELCKIIPWTPCRIKLIITEHQHCYKARWYLRITNSITGSTWYIPQITTSRYIPHTLIHATDHSTYIQPRINTFVQPHVLTRPILTVLCTTKFFKIDIYTRTCACKHTSVHLLTY